MNISKLKLEKYWRIKNKPHRHFSFTFICTSSSLLTDKRISSWKNSTVVKTNSWRNRNWEFGQHYKIAEPLITHYMVNKEWVKTGHLLPVGLCLSALEQFHHVWVFGVVIMGISWISKCWQSGGSRSHLSWVILKST